MIKTFIFIALSLILGFFIAVTVIAYDNYLSFKKAGFPFAIENLFSHYGGGFVENRHCAVSKRKLFTSNYDQPLDVVSKEGEYPLIVMLPNKKLQKVEVHSNMLVFVGDSYYGGNND